MRVIAIDAAKPKKARGFAVIEGLPSGHCSREQSGTGNPPNWPDVDWVVGELPWTGDKLRGTALVTFCIYNGFLLRNACNNPNFGYLAIPVRNWKAAILPGCSNMPKAVYTRNLARKWPDITDHNELDAIAMAVSVFTFTAEQLAKWKIKL